MHKHTWYWVAGIAAAYFLIVKPMMADKGKAADGGAQV